MSVIFHHGTVPLDRGQWEKSARDPDCVLICCARCATVTRVKQVIGANGQVSEPVRCDNPACKFHDTIRLENWKPEPEPAVAQGD